MVICRFMHIYTYICCIHTDAMNNRRAKTSLTNISLTLFVTFVYERELETEQNCNILTPTLIAVNVVSFSFSRAAQAEAHGLSFLLSAGFLYHFLSATSLQSSIGGPEDPFGRVWLSLPHLVSNFCGPQLNRGPRGPLQHGVTFSTTSLLQLQLSDFLSWLSYIIVQRPLNRPLNLWNGMFDRHQAEITVMQFRGDTLPVNQSMSVPWDFLLCPISLAKHAYAISSHNCHWNVSLSSGASPWNGKFGWVEGQDRTLADKNIGLVNTE